MLVINSDNTLLVENTKFYYGQEIENEIQAMPDFLKKELTTNLVHQTVQTINQTDKFFSFRDERYHPVQLVTKQNIDFKQSIGIGFFFPETDHLYGLP
jgi:hypothetical protein